jgi:hypothetical protein
MEVKFEKGTPVANLLNYFLFLSKMSRVQNLNLNRYRNFKGGGANLLAHHVHAYFK